MKEEFVLGDFGWVEVHISPYHEEPPKIVFNAFEEGSERTILEIKSKDKHFYETLLLISKEMRSGKKLKVSIETIDE